VILAVNAAPLRDAAGLAAGMVAALSDITERKQAEGEIRRLNVELEQRVAERTAELATANQELEAFSYSVSHDLRAPLRAIQGFGQVLREDYGQHLPAEGREHLARVLTASQRMERLIHDLLELSRVTRVPLDRTPVDLSALALTVGLELQAAHTGRTVEFVVQPGMSAEADPGLMRIVLENLLGNAWKFTREAAAARIEFGVRQREGEAVYQVRDNGTGFDMAHASRLFSPFQRLHSQHQFEGTGVGLATVQRIVRRHGGRVWAEGRVGQGATFFFTVPAG
jgi:light-regulated signal transduction histidine kinase (bacteriophytochrome)